MKNIAILLTTLLFAASGYANETEAKIDSLLKTNIDPYAINVSAYNNVGSIMSDDGKLRIISWNNRTQDGVFEYYTYFIYKKKHNARSIVKKMVCKNAKKPDNKGDYNANNWYGCLYYSAFAIKKGYMLLGYQTYRDISRVKVIEPLKINGDEFVLGDNVFQCGDKKWSRAVFEYSSNTTMSIEYDPFGRRFIFDHLSPENPNLSGIYQYYGPDFTYDAFTLKKKLWRLTEDIDIKNKE